MELQTLAQSNDKSKLNDWQRWALPAAIFLAQEGLLICALIWISPSTASVAIGAGFSLFGYLTLFWVQGYAERAIVGPYRFVRHPKQLGLWLLGIGFAVACRSFPALILALGLLPCLFFLRASIRNDQPDLKTYRYRYHVPALLPTLVPFRKDSSADLPFSWRRAIFPPDRTHLHSLASVFYGWICLAILSNLILPPWMNFLLLGLWLAGLAAVRLIIRKKSFRPAPAPYLS